LARFKNLAGRKGEGKGKTREKKEKKPTGLPLLIGKRGKTKPNFNVQKQVLKGESSSFPVPLQEGPKNVQGKRGKRVTGDVLFSFQGGRKK